MSDVGLVFAKQDEEAAEQLKTWLAARGDSPVVRVIEGLPAALVGEEVAPRIRDASACIVVVSPWLQASDWAFSAEAAAVRDRTLFWERHPVSAVYGCLASSPRVRELDALASRLAAPPGGVDAPVDDPMRARLSERLEGLFALLDRGVAGVSASIEHCASLLREGPQLLPGEFVGRGRYRLVDNVGHGPLASVWKAIARGESEPVAVRVLHGQFAGDAVVRERFFEMAQAMSSVEHPHVAQVVDDGGVERGFAYYVRSFMEGGALDAASLDELDALQAVLDVSRALEYAHAHGVLHQNVKPSNVLFRSDGSAVIGDFSVAGAERDAAEALYLAPETQDPRERPGVTADVYALAMTALFALNGGQLPFWVLRSPEKLIDGLDVSERVKAALHGALDWDPAKRTRSVAGFVSGLMGDAELVGRLGERARESGRFDVAASHLRELLDRGPGRDPALLLSLARTLLAAEDVEEAEAILLEVLASADSEAARDAAALLESVAVKTGRWGALASGLRVRALSGEPDASLLLRVARICQEQLEDPDLSYSAWADVLEHHERREQAVVALDFLTERARETADWPAFLRFGRQQWGFRRDDGELAFELGRACMDAMDDPHEALVWLERAMAADHLHDELAVRLEKIRSDRGEWPAVVSLMLERAESLEDEAESVELLIRASRVALHAHNDLEDAAAILLRVLLRNPEHREALRFLARHHARAGRDDRALALYGRLAPHEERSREGESVEVRVADNVDYARLLLRNDRPRGAQLCLEAALDLSPAHLPTLRLVSALSYDLGKWEEARVAYEGLVRVHSSAEPDPLLVNSLVRLGDLAWLEGRLSLAAGHYNRALELQPEHVGGWWGKAKVAIAGLAAQGEDALESEPWLLAPPVRITPHEALARLFAAVLHPPAIVAWMKLDAKGPEILQLVKGASPLVVASAAVDLMEGRSLIHLELFRRLGEAFPSWSDAVESVRRLWFDGAVEVSFPLTDAYRWHRPAADFDTRHLREAMCLRPPLDPAEIADVRPSLAALHHESAWRKLFRHPRGEPERPDSPAGTSESAPKGQSAILVMKPRSAEQRVVKADQTLTVGSSPADTYKIEGAGPAALKIERVGERFYAFRAGVEGMRLRGGEAFNLDGTLVEFLVFDADDPPLLGRSVEEESKPAKAALFYAADGAERMLPLPSEWMVLREAESGFDAVMTDSDVFDVKLQAIGGRFRVHERPDELEAMGGLGIRERWLEHNDEVVVGAVVLQFRLLNRAMETAPVEDLAALWGAPPGVPLLVYDDGTRHGRPVPLTKSAFAIGRGRDTDFQIAVDASLSRVHCWLDVGDDQVRIRDAGSANGTRVNGMRLSAAVNLADGDLIEIGQSRLEFRTKDGVPGALAQMSLQDFGAEDEPTDVLPVGEMSKGALGLDEGLDKIRVVNRVLEIALGALDQHDGPGRGSAELRVVVDVRPRTYQQLLEGVDIADNAIPGLEVMYNLAQRPETEQRPLLNHVLGDLIERVMERVCDAVPDDSVEPMLSEIAETRYREYLRF